MNVSLFGIVLLFERLRVRAYAIFDVLWNCTLKLLSAFAAAYILMCFFLKTTKHQRYNYTEIQIKHH